MPNSSLNLPGAKCGVLLLSIKAGEEPCRMPPSLSWISGVGIRSLGCSMVTAVYLHGCRCGGIEVCRKDLRGSTQRVQNVQRIEIQISLDGNIQEG